VTIGRGGTYGPLATVPLDIIVFSRTRLGAACPFEYRFCAPRDLEEAGFENRFQKDLNEEPVVKRLQQLWNDERGQDIAEYAVMLAVILVIVVGTVRLIGSNANNVFSQVGSAIQ
jgi:Flp pilus assembly pilin Flp